MRTGREWRPGERGGSRGGSAGADDGWFHMCKYNGLSLSCAAGQYPGHDCESGGPAGFQKDQLFYNTSNQFYPAATVRLGSPEGWMNMPVVRVQTNLVQFNPIDGAIRVAKQVLVRVNHAGPELTGPAKPWIMSGTEAATESVIRNFKKLEALLKKVTTISYLMLVDDAFVEEIKPLKDSLEASPAPWTVKVTVKKVPTDVKARPRRSRRRSRSSTTTRRRRRYRWCCWSVIRRGTPTVEYNEDTFYPKAMTDKPYTLVFKDDFIPDISLGRLSANTKAELNRIVKKTVHYRDAPVMGKWAERALLVCDKQDAPGKYAGNRWRCTRSSPM